MEKASLKSTKSQDQATSNKVNVVTATSYLVLPPWLSTQKESKEFSSLKKLMMLESMLVHSTSMERKEQSFDDYFPYDEENEVWAFSRPSFKTEIWVLIIEKAWAKIFGSYQRIEAGTAGEAMYPLTGSPHKFFLHEDYVKKDYIWMRIFQADKMKCPMATAVASQADEQLTRSDVKKAGLVDAHAYSLIAAKVITDDDGNRHRLIQIRNPWGKKEWQGDWSDKSDKWTPKTKS